MTRMALPPSRPPQDDPFRYGWRYVRRGEDLDQVPLTLEDVLHPQEEDFIVHSTAHDSDTVYLKIVLNSRRSRWRRRAVVLHDCRVAWGPNGPPPHGPDVAVMFGVRNTERVWRTFDTAAEGARPALVVEVTSPDTRKNDVGAKVQEYHQAGVAQYVVVDADERRDGRTLKLIGYRHAPQGYEEMAPDAQGRLPLFGLGLLLGVKGEGVVLYDAKTGEELGDYDDVTRELRAAKEAQGTAEEARQVAEEARREAERLREEEAEARAAAEARATDLAARLRELEQRLNPSNGTDSAKKPRHP